MANERATVFEYSQLQHEVAATPGTPTGIARRLQSTNFDLGVQAEIAVFRPSGFKFVTTAAEGREWGEARIDGIGSYMDTAFLLASVLNPLTGVTYYGGDTATARAYVFGSSNSSPDSPLTFTVQRGSTVRAHEFKAGVITEFGMNVSRQGITTSGAMFGHSYTDGASLTGATLIGTQVMLPTEFLVYAADTYAGLSGAAALTRCMSFNIRVANRYNRLFVLNQSRAFVNTYENIPDITAQLTMEADAEGMGYLTNMRAGSSKFFRLLGVGPTMAGITKNYMFSWDMCAKVSQPVAQADSDGIWAATWNMSASYDSTWGKAIESTLVTTLAQY